jgi:RimJ/RimL family protein N-acetyltransferase
VGSGISLTRPGARIALRPPREGDREALAAWHEIADASGGRDVLVITREGGDDRPIGVVEYKLDGRRKALTFEYVGIAPELRGYGLGSEAVRIVEADAHERGLARRIEARIGAEDGLALYFWLRLGCRPSVWPSEHEGGMIVITRDMGVRTRG